jgi:hypothetical protein
VNNEPDISELSRDVKRCVAVAKIAEFENQTYRVGDYVKTKLLSPAIAADLLRDVALANDLVREQGEDLIQMLIADGLTCKEHA